MEPAKREAAEVLMKKGLTGSVVETILCEFFSKPSLISFYTCELNMLTRYCLLISLFASPSDIDGINKLFYRD
jgi:hypothetical protein